MPTAKQLEEATAMLAGFDWSTVDALTDEEIIAAALADPDCELPSEAELAEFKLVTPSAAEPASPREAAE